MNAHIHAVSTAAVLVRASAQVYRFNRTAVHSSMHLLGDALRALTRAVPWKVERRASLGPDLSEIAITETEVVGCKALLLEIIRRAAYDWVLYRTSKVINKKKLAEDAYSWLFKEGPGHPNWFERNRNDKPITSLHAICSSLDLDIETVRAHVRRLTIKNVMSIGRPAEYRKQEYREESTTSVGNRLLSSLSDVDDLLAFDGLVDDT